MAVAGVEPAWGISFEGVPQWFPKPPRMPISPHGPKSEISRGFLGVRPAREFP